MSTPIDVLRDGLGWMAKYNLTGTEQTLREARELLAALDQVEALVEAAQPFADNGAAWVTWIEVDALRDALAPFAQENTR